MMPSAGWMFHKKTDTEAAIPMNATKAIRAPIYFCLIAGFFRNMKNIMTGKARYGNRSFPKHQGINIANAKTTIPICQFFIWRTS